VGKVEKNPTQIIAMNTLLEKVLTEKSARKPEEMEPLAAAQDAFETWD
jgi:hypothetical protein